MEPQRKQSSKSPRTRPPATTLEGRENQLISLAVDLVEKRLKNGSASSQETTHFLKLGSTIARLEKEILEEQKKLIKAKTEALESGKDLQEMYKNAIRAMKIYSGAGQGGEDDQNL